MNLIRTIALLQFALVAVSQHRDDDEQLDAPCAPPPLAHRRRGLAMSPEGGSHEASHSSRRSRPRS